LGNLNSPDIKRAHAFVVPGETLYMALKSTETEFYFTDCAFTAVQGHSVIGGKKLIYRFPYANFDFSEIQMHSPGLSVNNNIFNS